MQGDSRVTEFLNEVLSHELAAINQYFVDAKMCANWGLGGLATWFREASMEEMKDAEAVIDRILYLEGLPNVQRVGAVRMGENAGEKLRLALEVEREAVTMFGRGIQVANDTGDHGTRQQLEEMLTGEEQHIDFLETEISLLDRLGEPLYLSSRLSG